MKFIRIALLLFCILPGFVMGQSILIDNRTRKLLDELDVIVADKAKYHAQRDALIKQQSTKSRHSQGNERIHRYKDIYSLYSHYRTDSAQAYLDRIAALPEMKTDCQLQTYVQIGQAEILSVAGLYAQALDELKRVDKHCFGPDDKELKLFYLRTLRTLYGWMADYTEIPKLHKIYKECTQHYRDSLLMAEAPGKSHDIVAADKARAEGNPARSIELLLPYTRKMDMQNLDPYIFFTLSQAYSDLKNYTEANYYLTLTAIADLKTGTTEYEALPLLAQVMYETGDLSRAYTYLLCSMEDASLCKARLRSVEVSNIFPIINKLYKQQEAEKRQYERMVMAVIFGLFVLLCVMVFYLRKQMKRLRDSRHKLNDANEALQDANVKLKDTLDQLQETNDKLEETYSQLQLTDKVKEAYIGRYLDRCRSYFDTMEEERKSLLHLIKERRYDELYKQLKSAATIKAEQEKFYADLDAAFLTLFPDFIEKFNALLQPDSPVLPKHSGQLNTELRIFALIRLGITDTTRIAHFLNFSLATVYNYRSKIRNRSVGNPTEFEDLVANL